MKTISLVCVLAITGCSKQKTDFSEAKRTTETLTAQGITFTVEIPEGLPKDKHDPLSWSDAREEYDHVPHVFLRINPGELPKTEEAAMREAALRMEDANFVRKEKRPDGWALTDASPDKRIVEASRWVQIGDKVVKCTAAQVGDGELPSYDKTKAMLEAICDSVKAK
ncbi:MAG: hypothetical protein H0T46_25125 [Deltaproteobacteria bacterium]|nr:hypothetical protein [Deltaproteobacteria bacterium]